MAMATMPRNILLDRSSLRLGSRSPYPLPSPRILADKLSVKAEHNDGTHTPRMRASSDPPPSSEAKLVRTQSGRSDFDLEPNPFEQSFSATPSSVRSTARDPTSEQKAPEKRRARSQSPTGTRTPNGTTTANGQKLPPLSTIASPQVTGSVLNHFGWGGDHTLRSGPLSPAMLHGPTPGSVGFSTFANLFDASSFRTGLTPSVTGGPSGASYAMPSPSTQALFNLMTTNTDTPNASAAMLPHPTTGAYRSERDMPNHFDLGFRNVLDGRPAVDPGVPVSDTTGAVMPPMFASQPAPKPISIVPPQQPLNKANLGLAQSQGMYLMPENIPPAGSFGNQNPLYLLTQAQQELHDDDHIAAGVLSGLNTTTYLGTSPEPNSAVVLNGQPPYANGLAKSPTNSATSSVPVSTASPPNATVAPTTTGRKRKAAQVPTVIDEEVPIPPPAPRGRRKGTGKKQKVSNDDEDEDVKSRPETEEEKRKNFLERNRQAALKCRQRKKAWLTNLQAKVEYLTADNETLQTTVQALREEIASLRTLLIAHKDCPAAAHGGPGQPGVSTVGDFLAASQRPLPERPVAPPQAQFSGEF